MRSSAPFHPYINAFLDMMLAERNASANQWKNFTPSDRDYEYYMSKKEIYNRILGAFCADEFIRQHVQFIHIGA